MSIVDDGCIYRQMSRIKMKSKLSVVTLFTLLKANHPLQCYEENGGIKVWQQGQSYIFTVNMRPEEVVAGQPQLQWSSGDIAPL